MKEYYNYHKHSHISNIFTIDSTTRNKQYAERAVELGHTALSTCEHGTFGDIFECRTLANEYNLKCLPVAEFYMVKNADPDLKDKRNYHIIVTPKTNVARKKCNYISSMANIEGYYYKPRIDVAHLLTLDPDDVYITTACVAGMLRDEEGINDIFLPLFNHFKENILLEVQNHIDPKQIEINKRVLDFQKEYGLKIVAANDSHYIDDEGRIQRDELLRGKGMKYEEESGFILDYPDYDTMFGRFIQQGVLSESQIEEAIDNTMILTGVEEINLDHSIKMPTIDPDLTPAERVAKLKKIVNHRFTQIVKDEHIEGEDFKRYKDGIRYEMDIIEKTNDEIHTADYFLLNTKLVDLAVNKYGGVLTRGGRGSCASFYINRICGMTQLDRFKINLPIFPDRFASTARLLENRALPDIDYNVETQEPFVKAARELLGEHGCYPMYKTGNFQLKEAFKNLCRSKGIDFETSNQISADIDKYREDPEWGDLITEAEKYVGVIYSASVHACAHLLSNEDIRYEYGVLRFGDVLCVLITSAEADEYKVLKDDFLIVTVWHLIAETFKAINQPIMPARELLNAIKNDEEVWKLFTNGMTCTLNQVDSSNGTQQAKRYGIKSFEEGALLAAAIRPSFDSWREKFLNHEDYTTGSKQLDDVLNSTGGYILFQENLMEYFQWLEITPAESIGLIKKISKKKIKPQDFAKLEKRIRKVWIEKTGSEDMFDETWGMIQSCMSYGFCVSGDTKLVRNGNGKYQPTIEEMYNIKNDRKYAVEQGHLPLYSKYRSYGYGKALSLYDDGFVHENTIEDIYFTGIRQTYKIITESGKTIKCTDNHKFPTPNGVVELKDLQVGDQLYTIDSYQEREHSYRLTKDFEPNYPKVGQEGFQRREDGASVVFERERQKHKDNRDRCEKCRCQYNIDFELHHIDLDRTNNDPSNFAWLCNSCHKKVHYEQDRNKRYERGLTIKLDKIISIEKDQIEKVYSVSMSDPAHNYAVNDGIITHNCSAHAAATSLDMCYGAYLKVHYPLEYYTVCFNTYSDDADKTARLTQELDYFGIKIKNIKFRYSRGDYSFDRNTNSIYKGMASLPYLSAKVAEELYALKDNQYSDFIKVLCDIKSNTSADSRQIDILIKLDFFSEFGKINDLLDIKNRWEKYSNRKTVKKDSDMLKVLGIDNVRAHSEKETEKQFSGVNMHAVFTDWLSSRENISTSLFDKMDYEAEYLGYVSSIDPDIKSNYWYVVDVGGYSKNVLDLYQICDGQTQTIKIDKNYIIKKGDVIHILEYTDRPKWRKTGEDPETHKPKFEKTGETERVIGKIAPVNRRKCS